MICFEFLRIPGKNRKKGKPQNLGKHKAPSPQRRDPHCGIILHRSEGLPRRGEAEGLKSAPPPPPPLATLQRSYAMPQRSSATPLRRHCS